MLRIRKTVQIAVVVSMLLIIAASYGAKLYQVYGSSGGHLASLMESGPSFWLYKLFTLSGGALKEPVKTMDGFKGAYWSITIFGLTITDPLAGLGYLAAARNLYLPLFMGVVIPLLLALALGRVFCGWICPMNTLLEATDRLRGWLHRAGLVPSREFSLDRSDKYFLLVALFVAAAVSGVSIFPYLMPQLHMGKGLFEAVYFKSLSWGLYFILGIILFEVAFVRRGWCRYLCPAGALLSLLALPRLIRIERSAADCARDCSACREACPMGLEPNVDKSMMECTQCGLCLSECEPKLLGFRWRGSVKLALIAGSVLVVIALASVASAHHIRGLPHYGYAKNYPQNPTQERVIKYKNYYIYVTTYSFEGLQREKSDTPGDVQFYIYIKNMKNGQSYIGPMEVEIERKREKALYKRKGPDEEAIYRIRHAFEKQRGKCHLRIRFDGAGGREEARLKMKLH